MTRIDGALITAVKYFRPSLGHREDHFLSGFHYKFAFGVLLGSCILTGLTSWYSPIECTTTGDKALEPGLVKQWCYSNTTFVVRGPKGLFPGVQNQHGDTAERVVYLDYYKWITLALLIQASCFQVPRILWKSLERGKVRKVVDALADLDLLAPTERDEKLHRVATRFADRLRTNRSYFAGFVVSQIFYLGNVLLQICLTDLFLSEGFLSLLPSAVADRRYLDVVFPKVSKCTIYKFGSGGSDEKIDVLCVLPMNVLNEKIYLTMWLLFAITLLASLMQLLFVVVALASVKFRRAVIGDDAFDVHSMDLGDWLQLKLIRDNLDAVTYDEFLAQVGFYMSPKV